MIRIMLRFFLRLIGLVFIALTAFVLTLTALSHVLSKMMNPVNILIGVGLIVLVRLSREFVFNRNIEVGVDEAKIVRRWRGLSEVIFHGKHRLNFGDRITATYSLKVKRYTSNEEAVTSLDGDPLRVWGEFRYHVYDPLSYHLRGKKSERGLAAIIRRSLSEEIGKFSLDDLWDRPVQSNQAIRDCIMRKLKDCGIEISDFRLEEVVLPRKPVVWRRNDQQSISLKNYWQEFDLV